MRDGKTCKKRSLRCRVRTTTEPYERVSRGSGPAEANDAYEVAADRLERSPGRRGAAAGRAAARAHSPAPRWQRGVERLGIHSGGTRRAREPGAALNQPPRSPGRPYMGGDEIDGERLSTKAVPCRTR